MSEKFPNLSKKANSGTKSNKSPPKWQQENLQQDTAIKAIK